MRPRPADYHLVMVRDYVRRACRVAAFCAGAVAVGACSASFEIAATEVPRLKSGAVRDLDGETREVPERWQGEVLPVDPPGTLFVGDAASQRASEQDRVRFGSPLEGGIAPLGGGLAASRGDAPPESSGGYAPPPALWLRDADGRIVEIPLYSIELVRVKARGEGLGSGAIVAIVAGGLVVAGGFIAGIYGLSTALDSYHMN
jgi:hypothetical protein